MRVGPYTQQNTAQQNRRQPQQPTEPPMQLNRSPALMLAQRVLNEQGEAQAGHFLYAIRQFIAPAELAAIEQRLHVQSRRLPEYDRPPEQPKPTQNTASGGMDMQMLQMLMGLMNAQGGKADPMSLIKMLGGMNK